jgi:hypothetical protein
VWNYHGEQGPVGYLVTLNPRSDPKQTVLALNTYCRPFLFSRSMLGIWCPEAPTAVHSAPHLRIACFEPEKLEPFPLEHIAGWFKQSNERIYSATAPLAEIELSCDLPAGGHSLDVPPELKPAPELLLVSNYPAKSKDEPASAIFRFRPKEGTVQVLPQTWYTAAHYDRGYQWIARVVEDPVSGRIIGGGVRIQNFELAENGCDLGRWLED